MIWKKVNRTWSSKSGFCLDIDMSHLPMCERCEGNSFDGSDNNPTCPWCHKRKYRGSREELVEALNKATHTLKAVQFALGSEQADLLERVQSTLAVLEDV